MSGSGGFVSYLLDSEYLPAQSISCFDAWLYCVSVGEGSFYRAIYPIVICLPYIFTFYTDQNSTFIYFLLSRESYRDYLIFCFTFISMLFLELVFSQIIIITSETALSPMASIGIALGADVFLLVIIKCYFWFSGFKISQILPHNNLFLQFIFRDSYISGIESDIHLLVRPMI